MNKTNRRLTAAASAVTLACLLGTTAPASAEESLWDDDEQSATLPINDPLESWNRSVYRFNEGFDEYLLGPVARGYDSVTPQPVKQSASNFFDNLSYPVVIANDLLQGKFIQGGSDFARFLVNSTIGVFGIFDPASHLDMVEHKEDLGQTLATWGVPDGAYLVLPFMGPSSVRNGGGLIGDFFIDPLYALDDRDARTAVVAAKAVDTRYRLLDAGELVDQSAIDPYAFVRSSYLQTRQQATSE